MPPLLETLLRRLAESGPPFRPRRRAERLIAAHSTATPRRHFRLILRTRPVEGDVLAVLYDNPALPPKLRARLVREYRTEVWPEWIVSGPVLRQIDVDCFAAELAGITDATLLHTALRRVASRLDDAVRAQAYARLARVAGPEAVWAVELERVGDVASMAPYVRESMAGGGLRPLLTGDAASDDDTMC